MKSMWKKLSILALALFFVITCIPGNIYAESSDGINAASGKALASGLQVTADDTTDDVEKIIDTMFDNLSYLEYLDEEKLRETALEIVNETRNTAKEYITDEDLKTQIDTCSDEAIKSIQEAPNTTEIINSLKAYKPVVLAFVKQASKTPVSPQNSTDNSTKIEEMRSKGIDAINKRLEQANVTGSAKTEVLAAGMEATNAVKKANSQAEIDAAIAQLDQKIAEAKMTFKGKNLKASKNKKTIFTAKKAFKIKNAPSKLTYKKVNKVGKSKIKISKAGKITVAKGLKKGTYKVKVRVVSKATATLKSIKKETTVKITVK